MSKVFKFKQFAVIQDGCAMKVGTDGVLLGSWASIAHQPHTILDIGSGTGVVALQMAQRCGIADIEAIEIEENAFETCLLNFENSPWSDRLFCYHAGLDEFIDEVEDTYDLIVSNPPFYAENMSSGNPERDAARQNQSLPFEELVEAVAKLLSPVGKFNVVVPFSAEEEFKALAQANGLFPHRITRVRGRKELPFKRSLLEFGFESVTPTEDELFIEIARHEYTPEYIALTQDFYLKM
ncbi:MAG: methyltransferase [Bacteroidota bacterium]